MTEPERPAAGLPGQLATIADAFRCLAETARQLIAVLHAGFAEALAAFRVLAVYATSQRLRSMAHLAHPRPFPARLRRKGWRRKPATA